MINLFGKSRILNLFLFPLIVLVIWCSKLYHPMEVDTDNAFPLYYELLKIISFNTYGMLLLAMSLVLVQSYLFNNIVYRYDLLPESNDYTGVIYLLLMSCFPDQLSIHPVLLANFFLLIAIKRFFQVVDDGIFKNIKIYDIGLMIGIASLFYYPMLFTLPAFVISLISWHKYHWRYWVVLTMGVLTPILLWVIYLFFQDTLSISTFITTSVAPFLKYQIIKLPSFTDKAFILWLGLILLASLVQFFITRNSFLKAKTRLALTFFLLLLLLMGIGYSFAEKNSLVGFSFLAIPITLMVANFLTTIDRPFVIELVGLGIFIFILINQYSTI